MACKKGKVGEFSPALTVPVFLTMTMMEEMLVAWHWEVPVDQGICKAAQQFN